MFIEHSFYESNLNNYIILIQKNFSRESKAMKFEKKIDTHKLYSNYLTCLIKRANNLLYRSNDKWNR